MDSSPSKVLSPSAKPPVPPAFDIGGGYAAKYKKGLNLFDDTPDPRPTTAPTASASFNPANPIQGQYDAGFVMTRMRKVKPDTSVGYAGASNAAPRWGGKTTPLKGPGLVQADGKEFSEREYLRTHATKRRPGASSHNHQSLHVRDPLGQNQFIGIEEEDLGHTGRRIYPLAEVMYRKGSTNTLDGEDEEWKKARGYGQPGRQYRVQSALRVMGAQPDVPMEEVDPDYKNRSIRTGMAFAETEENMNTLKYRYSNGISFHKYEFDPTRKIEAVQHLDAVAGPRAKTQFHQNNDTYQMFRAKMNATSTIFSDPLYEKK